MKSGKSNGTPSIGQKCKFPAMALGLGLAMTAPTLGADFLWADQSADNSSWNGMALNDNVEFEFEDIGKAGTTTLELFDGGILTGGALKLQRNGGGDEAGESIINVGNGVGESVLTLYQLQLGRADDGGDVDRTATVNIAEGGTLIIDNDGVTGGGPTWGDQGVWMDGEDSSFNLFGDGKLSIHNDNVDSALDVDRVFGTDGKNNAAGGVDIVDDGTFTHYTAAAASTAAITSITRAGTTATIDMTGSDSVTTYTCDSSPDMVTWTLDVPTVPPSLTTSGGTLTFTVDATPVKKFYRIAE